jgi:F0F1-type ATP synthase gamma subunit
VEYLNRPLPIAGISLIAVGGIVYKILSMTSFGKKQVNYIKEQFLAVRTTVSDVKTDVEKYKEQLDKQYEEFTKQSNEKIALIYEEFDTLMENTLVSLEQFPNKKVQEYVAQFRKDWSMKKEQLIVKVTDSQEYVDDKVQLIKNEYESKYQEVLSKLEELINEKGINDKAEEE